MARDRYRAGMSKRNGDRARCQKDRKRKVVRRQRRKRLLEADRQKRAAGRA